MAAFSPFNFTPIQNFMYHGDTLGRPAYKALAKTTPWGNPFTGTGILGMKDAASFDPTMGKIKNPTLNRMGYGLRGIQSLGKSLLGMSPEVGKVGIGGGTLTGRLAYEKLMNSGFGKILSNPLFRGTNVAGLALGAGQLGYGAGNLLMDATGTRDDVEGLGAKLANTNWGQTIANKILGYSTPNITDNTVIKSLGPALGITAGGGPHQGGGQFGGPSGHGSGMQGGQHGPIGGMGGKFKGTERF